MYEEDSVCFIRGSAICETGGLADVVGSLPKYFDKKSMMCG